MPDGKKDVTKFTKYFNIDAPSAIYIVLILLIIGAIVGVLINAVLYPKPQGLDYSFIYGITTGIETIALPAILTGLLLKALKPKLKLRHSYVAVLAITSIYALFVLLSAALSVITKNNIVGYIVFVLGNGVIYGYWFVINKVVMDHSKGSILTAAIQPVLNISLFIPLSASMVYLQLPVNVILTKLWAGMIVFMLCGYAILYFMDRPAKRELNFSGVELMSAMIGQWMYGVVKDNDVLKDTGEHRDVPVSMLAIKNKSGNKAVFLKPDIHYGPLAGVGGSGATERIGADLAANGTVPFVMHGSVNLEDNPVSNVQISELSKETVDRLGILSRTKPATGNFAIGKSGKCKAIAIKIGDTCILTLTKAPSVTEDIDREVGASLAAVARKYVKNVVLLDAHNSRIESAPEDELRGVYKGSKYAKEFERAIILAMESLSKKKSITLEFGCASSQPEAELKTKDLGRGHLSVSVFKFGSKSFCMVYFDANNMLPSFRSEVLEHIKHKFDLDAELYTTDTHAVNSLALSVSNVLGRETSVKMITPILDELIGDSLKTVSVATSAYTEFVMKNFKVWGGGSEDVIMKVSRDIIRRGKRWLPILITCFFIIAIWVIYLV